jgi:TRL-like protein family
MKKTIVILTLCAFLFVTGCATLYPAGSIYTNIKLPVTVTANSGVATKVGTSQCTSILSAVAIGDASIETAKKNGGITKVYHVDYDVKNILGIVGTYKVTVYGE